MPFLTLFAFPSPVLANAVTSTFPATPASSVKTVTFEQFAGSYQFTGGPIQIGGLVGENITWETTQPFGASVIGEVYFYGFGGQSWEAPRTFVGLNGTFGLGGAMIFRFHDGPVSAVGALVNYSDTVSDGGDALMQAYDSQGNLLESYSLTADLPITGNGEFRGIVRQSADIAEFRLCNSFVAADDLTFTRPASPVPVPCALSSGVALLGCIAVARSFGIRPLCSRTGGLR